MRHRVRCRIRPSGSPADTHSPADTNSPADAPIVVVQTIRNRATVVDLSPAAAAHGVRMNLSLAEARALCPEVHTLDHDPAADQRTLLALARWAMRYTPLVCTGWPDSPGDKPDQPAHSPACLLLDVTGCERLFGSVRQIVRQIRRAMVKLNLPARVAAAPTALAAWALACIQGASGVVITPHELPAIAAGLPVSALRLPDAVIQSLHTLGLSRISQVLGLPRQTLPARFGTILTDRLDELLGDRPCLITPVTTAVTVEASMQFEYPLTSLELLSIVTKELLQRVLIDLQRRGEGARRIELLCRQEPASLGESAVTITKAVDLMRPTRDLRRMHELLCRATENLECGRGFIFVLLQVPLRQRTSDQQAQFIESHDAKGGTQGDARFEHLIERLAVRFGGDAIVQPVPHESYLPERAWQPSASLLSDDAKPHPPALARPLRLLPTPVEVKVVAEPCDDREGRPAQFVWKGQVYRLQHVKGPERIAGEWWRGHDKVRDYYDALDVLGRRFWIFRVMHHDPPPADTLRVRWFLHGLFD